MMVYTDLTTSEQDRGKNTFWDVIKSVKTFSTDMNTFWNIIKKFEHFFRNKYKRWPNMCVLIHKKFKKVRHTEQSEFKQTGGN